jgi:hypothetical protein
MSDQLKTTKIVQMKHADIMKCPHAILIPIHYNEDGSCRCNDITHTNMATWGYRWDGMTRTWKGK